MTLAGMNARAQEETAPQPAPATSEATSALIELSRQVAELEGKVKEKDAAIREVARQKDAVIDSITRAANAREEFLDKQLKAKDEEVTQYQKKFINVASNFLYIPYDRYSLDNLALPAFQEINGTALYKEYEQRETLLKNYEDNIKELIRFCSTCKIDNPFDISQEKKKAQNSFNALAVVTDYKKYSDWQNTYLGKYIAKISNAINAVNDNNYNNLEKQLKDMAAQLSAMLKAGNTQ